MFAQQAALDAEAIGGVSGRACDAGTRGAIATLAERIGQTMPDSAHALLMAQAEAQQVVSRHLSGAAEAPDA